MNVLYVYNNSSAQALTAAAISKIEHCQARYLVHVRNNKYHEENGYEYYVPRGFSKRSPVKSLINLLLFKKRIKDIFKWADVIHYVWDAIYPDGRDLLWAKGMGKPVFIEFVGSDIRDQEYLQQINPYYKKALAQGYEYKEMESGSNRKRVLDIFSKAGAIPTVCPEMSLFVPRPLFPKVYPLNFRINVSAFEARYPSASNGRRIKITHAPSKIIAKGTDMILPVLEALKEQYPIEVELLQNVPRSEVLKRIGDCDIFIDQIILGNYGVSSLEAMASGKPVLCYIMHEVFDAGLDKNCPIVNVNADNIKEYLIKLIENPQLRYDTGIQSRAFVEQYHDLDKIAAELIEMYQREIITS